MKKAGIILAIIVFFVAMFTMTTVNAESANVSISPSSGSVFPGDTVTIRINFRALIAYGFDVSYDTNLFEYVSGADSTISAGVMRVLFYDMTGGSAPETYTSMTFRAKAKGTGTFTVTGTGLTALINNATTTLDNSYNTTSVNVLVAPTGITLDQGSKTLQKGASFTLNATVGPSDASDKSVYWSSSNQDILTVSGGTVTSTGRSGTATIYARTVNGKEATCTVTVPSTPVSGITFDTTSKTLNKGEVLIIYETITPSDADNRNVTWSSSNPNVAKVDARGYVTALRGGETTITGTTEDGNKSATCKIIVPETKVTGITIGEKTKTITKGDTYQVVVSVQPGNADELGIIWSSSDDTIAKVDTSGLVTGMAKGKATITAKTVDGNKTVTCEIEVLASTDAKDATLESIKFKNVDIKLKFDSSITEYIIDVDKDITELQIEASTSNKNATFTIEGNKDLKMGENTVIIKVIAEDKETEKIYKIIVNRTDLSVMAMAGAVNNTGIDERTKVLFTGFLIAYEIVSAAIVYVMAEKYVKYARKIKAIKNSEYTEVAVEGFEDIVTDGSSYESVTTSEPEVFENDNIIADIAKEKGINEIEDFEEPKNNKKPKPKH